MSDDKLMPANALQLAIQVYLSVLCIKNEAWSLPRHMKVQKICKCGQNPQLQSGVHVWYYLRLSVYCTCNYMCMCTA